MRKPFVWLVVVGLKRAQDLEHGGVTILWAIALPVILGFIALGVETSAWYVTASDLQSATDAAALATVYSINSSADLSSVAAAEMARNGFGPDTRISVTVNVPPQAGAYAGNTHALEIISSLPQKVLLGNVVFKPEIIK